MGCLDLFLRNPLVPCDAITIPEVNLEAWKEILSSSLTFTTPALSPPYEAFSSFPSPPQSFHQPSPPAPQQGPPPSPQYFLHNSFHQREPKVSPAFRPPQSKIKPFIHHQPQSPQSFNLNLRYG